MKRKIKLTESQLHNIISESVQEILSELDWRTYQSAFEKDEDPNYPKKSRRHGRSSDFRQAANNAFNRQNGYGLHNVPYGAGKDDKMTTDGEFYVGNNIYRPGVGNDQFVTTSGNYNKRTIYNDQQVSTEGDKRGQETDDWAKDWEEEGFRKANGTFKPQKLRQMRGDKQVRDYFSGKTQYKNGKWQ